MKMLKISDVLKRTAEYFGVRVEEIVGDSRDAKAVRARQVAMFLANEHTYESLENLSDLFGGKTKSTIYQAAKVVEAELPDNPKLRAEVDAILSGNVRRREPDEAEKGLPRREDADGTHEDEDKPIEKWRLLALGECCALTTFIGFCSPVCIKFWLSFSFHLACALSAWCSAMMLLDLYCKEGRRHPMVSTVVVAMCWMMATAALAGVGSRWVAHRYFSHGVDVARQAAFIDRVVDK